MNEDKKILRKYRVLGIVGPSGSGKDAAARHLTYNYPLDFHSPTMYTTRPRRDENENYYFLTDEEFALKLFDVNDVLLTAQSFNGWYYGLAESSLDKDKINVIPMTINMIEQLMEAHETIDLTLLHIQTNDKQRLLHILDREDEPDCREVCRRFLADKVDFEDIEDLNMTNIRNDYTEEFYKQLEQYKKALKLLYAGQN